MLIHEGTRLQHIVCGVKVVYGYGRIAFSQLAMGDDPEAISEFPVPKTTRNEIKKSTLSPNSPRRKCEDISSRLFDPHA